MTSTSSSSFDVPLRAARSTSFSRPAALIGGATALIALTAIATTLVVRPASTLAGDPGAEARAATIAAKSLLSSADEGSAPTQGSAAAGRSKQEPAASPPRASGKLSTAAPAVATPSAGKTVAAAACPSCGVVEAVTPFQKKGEGTGVGAVGGAVVGGLLGSQVGGGNGKKAMTVIGAVGGGMAGHEIEKRQRATTLYAVKVRMSDGSLRTVTQSAAPQVGAKVTLEGSQLKPRAS